MVRSLSKIGVFLLLLCMIACSTSDNKSLSIMFSADSTAIVITNIDKAGLLQVRNLNLKDSAYSELISVLQTPSERDPGIREELVAGRYLVSDSNIVFLPNSPFIKNRDYLVVTHINSSFGDAEQILKGSLSTGVKPKQQLLSR